MKKLFLLLLTFCLSVSAFCQQSSDTVIANNPQNLKLKVYYFHITNRCNTCRSIEANVRKTLTDYFLNQLETGVINLYVINCELPENKELVQKYDAYGATLALTSMSRGKDGNIEDLTSWAFQKAHNPEVFINELKTRIEELIQ
ncbi:MAG: nitrophenyl compound nitroreductase subunit ArsF family protein [Bacteroidota bacterium]